MNDGTGFTERLLGLAGFRGSSATISSSRPAAPRCTWIR